MCEAVGQHMGRGSTHVSAPPANCLHLTDPLLQTCIPQAFIKKGQGVPADVDVCLSAACCAACSCVLQLC